MGGDQSQPDENGKNDELLHAPERSVGSGSLCSDDRFEQTEPGWAVLRKLRWQLLYQEINLEDLLPMRRL